MAQEFWPLARRDEGAEPRHSATETISLICLDHWLKANATWHRHPADVLSPFIWQRWYETRRRREPGCTGDNQRSQEAKRTSEVAPFICFQRLSERMRKNPPTKTRAICARSNNPGHRAKGAPSGSRDAGLAARHQERTRGVKVFGRSRQAGNPTVKFPDLRQPRTVLVREETGIFMT